MEEVPENGKKSSQSAHASGVNDEVTKSVSYLLIFVTLSVDSRNF
jgi:hypothetical protein